MSIEAMKQARSVISSINQGKQHALTVGNETVFWQREEWVRWALDEVLPLINQAIAEAEKQEPFGWYSVQEDEFMTHKIRKEHESLNSYTHKVGKFDLALYTSPPQRPVPQEHKPLTDDLLCLLKEARKIIRASSSRNLVKDWDARATKAIADHGSKGEA